jgi:hypothetical protein
MMGGEKREYRMSTRTDLTMMLIRDSVCTISEERNEGKRRKEMWWW